MHRLAVILLIVFGLFSAPARAQQGFFIQIEAQPNQAQAERRAVDFDTVLDNVNGFALGGGWYGIALGPFSQADAQSLLRVLRSQGRIPADSYLTEAGDYGTRFYPQDSPPPLAFLGIQPPQGAEITPDAPAAQSASTTEPAPSPAPEPEPEPEPADETVREARQSEALLSREERMELQVALQWAGFYNSAIDGAFGRGTRNAMANWQEANSFETTGVLTTRQREVLFKQYNAVLDGMGLALVNDPRAGIEMELPTGVVQFTRYEAPFVHFDATGSVPAQVLLISQPGDQNTLFGLYEIMQTLEIVPLEGPRERGTRGFTLEGRNARIVSYTQAALADGAIKGFTLIWPAGDEERRTRILDRMKASFRATGPVLDPAASTDEVQQIDLVAGLQVRKPLFSRSGLFVDNAGHVLTTLQAVAECGRITLDTATDATVTAQDTATGLALLTPTTAMSPMQVAAFAGYSPRLNTEIAVAGYSYEGQLGAPTLTFGTLADLKGLAGNTDVLRLDIETLPGDAGGPVTDMSGAVLGLLASPQSGARQLPGSVGFATNAATAQSFLSGAGIAPETVQDTGVMAPEDLSIRAGNMTVLVSCWE